MTELLGPRPYYDNKSLPDLISNGNSEDVEEQDEGDEKEEDDFNLPLPGNIYSADPKFERQERLDVKKPGPWFSVNNFAFESDTPIDTGALTDDAVWLQSDITQDADDADYLLDVIQNAVYEHYFSTISSGSGGGGSRSSNSSSNSSSSSSNSSSSSSSSSSNIKKEYLTLFRSINFDTQFIYKTKINSNARFGNMITLINISECNHSIEIVHMSYTLHVLNIL